MVAVLLIGSVVFVGLVVGLCVLDDRVVDPMASPSTRLLPPAKVED